MVVGAHALATGEMALPVPAGGGMARDKRSARHRATPQGAVRSGPAKLERRGQQTAQTDGNGLRWPLGVDQE